MSKFFDDYLDSVSGKEGSALDRALLDFEGRRMLGSALADLPRSPIRVYAGVRHGDAKTRAQLIVDELERLGAASRAALVLAAPTGRGWANHVMLRSFELLLAGDSAIACSQFGAERSVDSAKALPIAVESFRALLTEVRARPSFANTPLFVVGESLGAWTISELLGDVTSAEVSGVLLVATPGVAQLSDQGQANEIEELRRQGAKVVVFARHDDPVAAIPGARLAWQPNARWRGADSRGWMPLLSALRAKKMLDVVTRIDEPTRLDLTAHDYRSDFPRLVARVLGVSNRHTIRTASQKLLHLERDDSTWLYDYGPAPHEPWPGLGA